MGMKESDTVVLNKNIKESRLKKGDIGTIVHIYDNSKTLEVEFITAKGKTVAVLTLATADVRPIEKNEILHIRGYASF